MKRWRIAHLDVTQGGLNGFRGTALYPWYDIRDGKYVFERGRNTPKQLRIFLEKIIIQNQPRRYEFKSESHSEPGLYQLII